MKLNIETFPIGPIHTNCFLVWPENSVSCWIVDPGGSPEPVIERINAHGLKPEMIVLTHGHWDHFIGNTALKETFPNISIAVHEADADVLPDAEKNMSLGFIRRSIVSPPADVILHDGDHLKLGEVDFTVIHTPGHTPGGVCLHSPDTENKVVLVGDLIFAGGGVGRTDLPNASTAQLYQSIAKLLNTVSDDTTVYPGHGPATVIEREKRFLADLL
jgi:glyoxylase-like metal-dependent hydrolase (beta-lactamase superfamily II)